MNWKKNIIIFVAVFLLIAMFVRPGGCAGQGGAGRPPEAEVVTLKVPGKPDAEHRSSYSYTLRAELADTDQKRQKGLSERRGLEQGYGMLYVYEESKKRKFSEEQTSFPLSVAFLDKDGTILGIRRTEPHEPGTFEPEQPARYVLEARQGWFEDRGLGKGDRLELPSGLTSRETAKPTPREVPADTPVQ